MKKIFTVSAVISFLILAALVFFVQYNKSTKKVEEKGKITNEEKIDGEGKVNNFPIPKAPEGRMNVKPESGDDNYVTINDVFKEPQAKPLSQGGVNFKSSEYYYMAYYPNQQGFIISILNSNLEYARNLAESDFIGTLGITQEEACKLNVSLTVPGYVDKNAAGGNYGLSFCPGGKSFPAK